MAGLSKEEGAVTAMYTDWLLAPIAVALFLIFGELRALRANIFIIAQRALPGDWASHLRVP
jgi:hypothetical protein